MKKSYVVNGLSYQPRQGSGSNGNIGQHTVSLSADGETWEQVAFGAYLNDGTTKRTFFSNATARYVRLTAQSEAQGQQFSSAAELNVYSPDPALDAAFFEPLDPAVAGRWTTTLDLPLVPAAAALVPDGSVVLWSAYRPDLFSGGTGLTQTVVWSPNTETVSQNTVSNTRHDMFVSFLSTIPSPSASARNLRKESRKHFEPGRLYNCPEMKNGTPEEPPNPYEVHLRRSIANPSRPQCPGISLDAEGRIVVTGGNDEKKTSIYDPGTKAWTTGPQMNVGRGYQSSTTVADGRVFTIGGSWSGGRFQKDGEVYEPGGSWTNATGCKTAPLLTADKQGIYRRDNHAWLFAWRRNSVFHAGPSRSMNWYGLEGAGSVTPAGRRADAADAMCGVAAMYDATRGRILAAGGSPDYQDSDATRNAYHIELGNEGPGGEPAVTKLPPMAHARAFGSAVVLPDGTVLVVGGQARAVPFTDTTPALPAELFEPSSSSSGAGEWRSLAPIAVPRTYHSFALLLPDATVLAGGGGLCGTGCPQNHLDAQIFEPPYLFEKGNGWGGGSGTRAARPAITSVSPTAGARPGASLEVVTDGPVRAFALVRHGSVTHTVNTDQRRVPLAATPALGLRPNTYRLALPGDPGVLLPGYWMLFAIDAAGVPSVAATVHVLLP